VKIITHIRPSSHSESYTIVATFETNKRTAKVAKNRRFRHESCATDGKRLFLFLGNVYSDEVDNMTCDLERYYHPKKVEVYSEYQEIKIKITLPKGATVDTAPLLLTKDQMGIIINLIKLGKKPLKKDVNKKTEWTFRYAGEKIYYNRDDLDDGEDPEFRFEGLTLNPGKAITVESIKEW
jgi:hypothetical protein